MKNADKLNDLTEHCQTLEKKVELYEMKLEEEITKNQVFAENDERVCRI